jgi:hypothetical protein
MQAAATSSRGCQRTTSTPLLLLRARGLESEAQVAYSGLFDFCRPLLGSYEVRGGIIECTVRRSRPRCSSRFRRTFRVAGLQPPQSGPSSLKPRGLSSRARTMCIVHFFCHPLEIVVLRQPRHSVSRISALAVCGARRRSGTNHMTATAAYTIYDPTGMTNAKPTPAA